MCVGLSSKYRCRKCRRLLTGTQGAVLGKGQTPWRHLISTNLTLFNPISQHPSITLLQFYHPLKLYNTGNLSPHLLPPCDLTGYQKRIYPVMQPEIPERYTICGRPKDDLSRHLSYSGRFVKQGTVGTLASRAELVSSKQLPYVLRSSLPRWRSGVSPLDKFGNCVCEILLSSAILAGKWFAMPPIMRSSTC